MKWPKFEGADCLRRDVSLHINPPLDLTEDESTGQAYVVAMADIPAALLSCARPTGQPCIANATGTS